MIFPIMSEARHRPGPRNARPVRVAFRAQFGASRGSTVPEVLSGLARPSPRSCRPAARNSNETSFLYRPWPKAEDALFRSALTVMAGLDPAIHANTPLVEFAWIPGTRPGMTVVARAPTLQDLTSMGFRSFRQARPGRRAWCKQLGSGPYRRRGIR